MSLPHRSNSSPIKSSEDELRGEIFDIDVISKSSARRSQFSKISRGVGFVAVPVALYGMYALGIFNRDTPKPQPIGPFPPSKVAAVKLKVHVAGSVKKPGVYTLDENARVGDAIEKAGGPLPQANLNNLNLADWVEDGSKIVVPSLVKATPTPIPVPQVIEMQAQETPLPRMGIPNPETPQRYVPPTVVYVPQAPVAPPATTTTTRSRRQPKVDDGLPRDTTKSGAQSANISTQYLLANPLDINQATAYQLEGLPDVGPKTAERIVAYRTSIGRFSSVDQLDNVKGIGGKTLVKLKPYVVVR